MIRGQALYTGEIPGKLISAHDPIIYEVQNVPYQEFIKKRVLNGSTVCINGMNFLQEF